MHNPIDRIAHTTAFVTPVVEHWLEWRIDPMTHCAMSDIKSNFKTMYIYVCMCVYIYRYIYIYIYMYVCLCVCMYDDYISDREKDNERKTTLHWQEQISEWPCIRKCIKPLATLEPMLVSPLSYFSFQPVLHDWCNKGRGMCYPVHIKEPLLSIGKSSPMWQQRVSSHYLCGPLPYVWRHITVNKMCWVHR